MNSFNWHSQPLTRYLQYNFIKYYNKKYKRGKISLMVKLRLVATMFRVQFSDFTQGVILIIILY